MSNEEKYPKPSDPNKKPEDEIDPSQFLDTDELEETVPTTQLPTFETGDYDQTKDFSNVEPGVKESKKTFNRLAGIEPSDIDNVSQQIERASPRDLAKAIRNAINFLKRSKGKKD